MSPGDQQFFHEEEADEILRLAVSKSAASGGLSREQLMATAAELGISEDAVREAESEVSRQRKESEELKSTLAEYKIYRGRKVRDLWGRVATFSLVVGLLFPIAEGSQWWYWMAGFWGLGVFKDAWSVLTPRTMETDSGFYKWKNRKITNATSLAADLPDQAIQDYLVEDDSLRSRIGAIRAVREASSMDLKAAKDYVDNWERRNPNVLR